MRPFEANRSNMENPNALCANMRSVFADVKEEDEDDGRLDLCIPNCTTVVDKRRTRRSALPVHASNRRRGDGKPARLHGSVASGG